MYYCSLNDLGGEVYFTPVEVDKGALLKEILGINDEFDWKENKTMNKETKTLTATELYRIENGAYNRGYERGRKVGFSEGSSTHAGFTWHNPDLKIKKVIFNDPATIVFWADGTKTVAKAHGDDKFDKEVGLTVCIAKKALGNRRHFDAVFKKWIK